MLDCAGGILVRLRSRVIAIGVVEDNNSYREMLEMGLMVNLSRAGMKCTSRVDCQERKKVDYWRRSVRKCASFE